MSPLLHLVQSRLAGDEIWNVKSSNDLWICPFCLSGIAKRPGLSHPDSIARHLENCRSFAMGKGQLQPRERVMERRAYENIIHAAQTDPAWRVYDSDGVWISPFSLQRVVAVRAIGGKIDNFLFQALARHLASCAFYRQGIAHTVDEVMLARELLRRMKDVSRYVSYQLHTQPGWRFVDAQGHWICPFTLFTVPQLRVDSAADWLAAPETIALHLITHCPRFATGQVAAHPDATIANTAGPGGRCLPPPDATTPTPVSPTQILGTTTRSGLAILSPTPTGQAITPSGSTSGYHQVQTPTPTAGPPPVSGHTGGFLFSRTPLPGAPEGTLPVTRRISSMRTPPPVQLPPARTPPLAPPTTPPRMLAMPIATPLPLASPAPVQPKEHQDGDHLDWMEEADSTASREESIVEAPRTDMIHARKLQEKMLQQPPAVPGFQFATRFEACADITGDFFVFINLPDGRTGLALGDVSGHGVQAGLIMSMAKNTLEIYAEQGLGPADTLARVNDALVADLGGKMFISMVYGILDPQENIITWARAGHNPGLHFNLLSENLVEIKPRGMVVGMKSGAIFRQSLEEETTRLEAGDVFLLYTDGITETMNLQHDEFGTERLGEILKQFAGDGPEKVVEQIMERLRHFRGPRPAADDATMVALLVE